MSFDADVVVVGAGIAGALVAARLAAAGVKVTVLEAGPRVDRGAAVVQFYNALVKVPECAYPNTAYAPHPRSDNLDAYYVQTGPQKFSSTYLRQVGGTTWHFLGTFLRLVPDDFRLASRFGRGVDWPIDYAALEPWYSDAENEVGVAGDSAQDLGLAAVAAVSDAADCDDLPRPPGGGGHSPARPTRCAARRRRATPWCTTTARRAAATRAASRYVRSRPSTTPRCTSRRPRPQARASSRKPS